MFQSACQSEHEPRFRIRQDKDFHTARNLCSSQHTVQHSKWFVKFWCVLLKHVKQKLLS